MKRATIFFLLVGLALQGATLYAVDTLTIALDRAFYKPGEAIQIHVNASGAQAEVVITHLTAVVTTLTAPLVNGAADLSWTPPPDAPRGYGLDVRALDDAGNTLATTSAAFDVLERWTQAPRYGYLVEFQAGRSNIAETMTWATRFHINGLQFYDWQYRHEALLPPAGTDIYSDLLGRNMSMQVVNDLIAAAHARGIAAMPYTAIYGASAGFYEQHKAWALFQSPGEPYRFGDNFLMIMDPTPGSPWADHLLNEFARVLDETDFDGIHIDQYGAPKVGLNNAGETVNLDESFPGFINASAEVVQAKRGDEGATIFNCVGNWPVDTVAPSNEDAVYIEVWQPFRNFLDLYRVVTEAQRLGGNKPVIIAAYISPEHVVNVRLANAIIFASGGFYLELGEPNTLLADPYFPKYGILGDDLAAVLERYFNFQVRYENLLALGTTDTTADRAAALSITDVRTKGLRSYDRVAVITRAGADFETFSLVNLLDLEGGQWDTPVPSAPTAQTDLEVTLHITRALKNAWFASPDGDDLSAQPITYTTGTDDAGDFIRFTLPSLDYWTMIVVKYQ